MAPLQTKTGSAGGPGRDEGRPGGIRIAVIDVIARHRRHPTPDIAVIGNQTLPLIMLIDVDQKFHRSERRASLRTDVSKITGK